MSVAVSMPQLGESVTEGTVTRWLKKEGEHVTVDEPLLEVSTDKVDTEIPSPATGILRGIAVDEDETVAVGAQLAVIEEEGSDASQATAPAPSAPAEHAPSAPAEPPAPPAPAPAQPAPRNDVAAQAPESSRSWNNQPAAPPAAADGPPPAEATAPPAPAPAAAPAGGASQGSASQGSASQGSASQGSASQGSASQGSASQSTAQEPGEPASAGSYPEPTPLPTGEGSYVTPLVRKLAAEHSVPLESISGTGVGGRIRKQDVLEAARAPRAAEAAAAEAAAQASTAQAAQPQQPAPAAAAAPAAPVTPSARPALVPSSLRGTTERMSRPRQV